MLYFLMVLGLTAMNAHANPSAAENILNSCINEPQLNVECKYLPASSLNASEGPIAATAEKAFWTPLKMLSLALESIGVGDRGGECARNGGTQFELESITSLLQHAKITHKMSDCQAACLAICATRKAISFDSWRGWKTPCTIMTDAVGICSDFSTLSVFFLTRLGLQAWPAYYTMTGPHNFLRVKLNSKEYFMEPQSSACEFFEATYQTGR